MTINELGSAIRNHVHDGLKGEIPTTSYSREQMIKEAFLYLNRVIMEFSMKGNYDLTPFFQTIDAIPIEELDMSKHVVIKSGICRNIIKIPVLSSTFTNISIEYIGPVSKDKSFSIYYDTKFSAHKFRLRTSKKPFVLIDMDADKDGFITIEIYNLSTHKDLRYLTVRGIFADPMALKVFDCCTDIEEEEFPAPAYVQEMIIEKLTQRYISQYRQMNIPLFANKQNDIQG